MINPLTLQDPSRPIVVSLVNKKSDRVGSTSGNNTSGNTFDMHTPSITLSKTFSLHAGNNKIVMGGSGKPLDLPPQPSDPVHNLNLNQTFQLSDMSKPTKHLVIFLYVFVTLVSSIVSLVLPYFQRNMFIILLPIISITVYMHIHLPITQGQKSAGNNSSITWALGWSVILFFPLSIVFPSYHFDILVASIFITFLIWPALKISSQKAWIKQTALAVLALSAVAGMLVYQVYPRSIHGMHAAFLSICVLACCSVYFLQEGGNSQNVAGV